MPSLNSAEIAAIGGSSFAVAWQIYLAFSGDPLRVTTFGADQTFSATGDADLDGFTFKSFDGRVIDISDVSNNDTGSDAVTVTVSGIQGIDANLLTDIATRSIWQGQEARLWFMLYDAAGVNLQGAIVPFYTGKMSKVTVMPGAKTQSIQLSIENYLAVLNDASNRSYLNQSTYDSADVSASATLAAANGAARGGVGVPTNPGAGAGGGGGGRNIGGGMVWRV